MHTFAKTENETPWSIDRAVYRINGNAAFNGNLTFWPTFSALMTISFLKLSLYFEYDKPFLKDSFFFLCIFYLKFGNKQGRGHCQHRHLTNYIAMFFLFICTRPLFFGLLIISFTEAYCMCFARRLTCFVSCFWVFTADQIKVHVFE